MQETIVGSIEKHLEYCSNEMNPILGLIKGKGTLSISDIRLGTSLQMPNHILTAYFEHEGNINFLSPIIINRSENFCEFMQKFTFNDLPPEFSIRFVIAELPLPQMKEKTKKNKIIKKMKELVEKSSKWCFKELFLLFKKIR